ncbi:MAG: HAD-IA family hydrolase [Pirellulales bacterium]
MQRRPPIRGLIFDLDGTLVDSGLDFELMRSEMGLKPGRPLLEALAELDPARADECRLILSRHERDGALRATLMPGVHAFLNTIAGLGLRQAVLTRNSREAALATLDRLGLDFDPIVARDDAPAKPDPAAIWKICEVWGLPREQVAMIGDFYFDIEAGRRAGVRTVLYTGRRDPLAVEGWGKADFCLQCFADAEALLAWLEQPD